MYSPQLLEHFEHPRNAGELEKADAVAEAQNPVCGDVLRLSLQVTGGKITQARFQAKGCVPAMACGSLLTEMLTGRSLEETASLTSAKIEAALGGLPAASHHAGELAIDALRTALTQLQK